MDKKVDLIPVTQGNRHYSKTIEVTQQQKDACIVLDVTYALEFAKDKEYARPFFITLDGKVIGFTMFAFDESIEEICDRYWLWQFVIDKNYQGRGLAQLAMPLIIEYFRNQRIEEITLSTKPTNINALHLYKKFGFVENGEMNDDEVVLKYYINE